MRLYGISEAARLIGARARDITLAFYARQLDDGRCPVVGGRRVIPAEYLPEIEAMLRGLGRLQEATHA